MFVAFIACLVCLFKGTDETPWLGSKPVCLARASQRLLALWHVLNHAFAGLQVMFVNSRVRGIRVVMVTRTGGGEESAVHFCNPTDAAGCRIPA